MANIEAIPAALGLLLRVKGLSQKELAERSGMREEQVSRYLGGKVPNLGVRQLFRFLEALEVDLATFHFALEAVMHLEEVVDPRQPEDRRRLNRRVWRFLLAEMTPQATGGTEDGDPGRMVLRLLGELENAGEDVAAVRRGLMELLAVVGQGADDGGDGG